MISSGPELLGLLKANKLSNIEAKILYRDLKRLMEICDELDSVDAFGTEGWQHRIGWDI